MRLLPGLPDPGVGRTTGAGGGRRAALGLALLAVMVLLAASCQSLLSNPVATWRPGFRLNDPSVPTTVGPTTTTTTRHATTTTTSTTVAPTTTARATTTTAPPPPPRALLGLISPDGTHYAAETAAGVQVVTVAASWASSEPSQGTFSTSYADLVRSRIAAAHAAGLEVILDPGMQFTPSWVFDLPGGTRFVDQFGDVFSGAPASGDNVANAVTNGSVRSALGQYLAWLGAQIPAGSVWGVRQGGGPLGELRYPAGSYNGHTGAYWAYDASTQAASAVPGWRPGTGTTAQAQQFLNAYNGALDVFGQWLNGQFATDFATRELIMLPGWGQRPGVASKVVNSLLTMNDEEFNQGLDWTNLLSGLPDPHHSIAYTTYLDAPSTKATTELEDPADFLSGLVASDHLAGLGGENTGTASTAAMSLVLTRARDLNLAVMCWMNEARLLGATGKQPTLATLKAQAAAILG
jgi:hypothetical protein